MLSKYYVFHLVPSLHTTVTPSYSSILRIKGQDDKTKYRDTSNCSVNWKFGVLRSKLVIPITNGSTSTLLDRLGRRLTCGTAL